MKDIIWTEQHINFGLDYSTKKGKFHDYSFDIRYDYDGKSKFKPKNCGLTLIMCKNKTQFYSTFGPNIDILVKYCENFLQKEKLKFS